LRGHVRLDERGNLMIVDYLNNWKAYFISTQWGIIFNELCALSENTPEMEKVILGDDIILKIFSHKTIGADDAQAELESHKKYIDIHTTIAGRERIDWYPATSLKIIKPYDAVEDAVYYARQEPAGASIVMCPGIFVLFGPYDAHMPRLRVISASESVKKAVMKIKVDAVR
jgi:YhcH/YjgK/YiaL family protein